VINIANCYQAMGQYDEAEKYVLDYMAKGFDDSQLFFLLGTLMVNHKEPEKAVPYFEKCLAGNPQSASAHNGLAAIYLNRSGDGDLARAEEHLKAALALNPRLQSVRYNMAQLLEKQSRFPEAADYYLQEIQDSAKSFKALFNLSRVYRLMGREEEEYDALQKTITVNPEFPVAYFYLARIYLRRGERYQEAIDLVKKGIDLKPEKTELPLGYFLLADLYNRIGDVVKSEEYARKGQVAAAVTASKQK
jgi:tetratricopeptide (TPR) repeat protein